MAELVDGARPDPVELGRAITMKTAECEGVELVAEHLARVAAARVISVEPIPGSHHGFPVVPDVPRQTQARPKVVVVAAHRRMVRLKRPKGLLPAGQIHGSSLYALS